MSTIQTTTVKANTLLHSDGSTTNPPAIPALDQRMATAWVNFNGKNTISIRDSYNVSSLGDIGVGEYTVNFATNMANTNYAVVGATIGASQGWYSGVNGSHAPLVGSISFKTPDHISNTSLVLQDTNQVNIIVFGG